METGIRGDISKWGRKAYVLLAAANCLCFLLSEFIGQTTDSDTLVRVGALYTPLVTQGQYWRLLTAMFLHAGMAHLLNNMVTLCVLGGMLEDVIGKWRFLLIYLAGGLAGNVTEYMLSVQRNRPVVAVGASGAVFSVMGAVLFVIIRTRGRGFRIGIRRMVLFVALSVYFGFVGSNVANAAHLTGLGTGFLLGALLFRMRMTGERDDPFRPE